MNSPTMYASATMNRRLFEFWIVFYMHPIQNLKSKIQNRLLPIILIAFCWIGLAVDARAQQAVPELTGRVVDRADILSSSTENTITALLAAHEDATSNQLAVLTIASLEGEPIEAYSLRVAETWALGTAANDNGVLLLVAVEDRALRIEVGYGLEGYLTDAIAGRIIRNEIVPLFRKQQYDTGVLVGVQSILGVIEGTYTPSEGGASSSDQPPFIFRLIFGLMFSIMPLVFFVPSFLIAGQWGNLGFMGLFFIVGGAVCFFSVIGIALSAVVYVGLLLVGNAVFRRQENWHEMRRKVNEALKENRGRKVKVNIGSFTFNAGGITTNSGGSGRSGGGWSGGSSFSGGGGSFGGGGSSGSW